MDFLNKEIRKAGKEETRNGTGKAGKEHRTPNQPTPGLRLASIQHRTSLHRASGWQASNIEHRRVEGVWKMDGSAGARYTPRAAQAAAS
jgi:hypothetical protein